MQFWPPGNEYICSKHVGAWNKLIVKQRFCASSWLITEKIYWDARSAKRQNLSIHTSYTPLLNVRPSAHKYDNSYCGYSNDALHLVKTLHSDSNQLFQLHLKSATTSLHCVHWWFLTDKSLCSFNVENLNTLFIKQFINNSHKHNLFVWYFFILYSHMLQLF